MKALTAKSSSHRASSCPCVGVKVPDLERQVLAGSHHDHRSPTAPDGTDVFRFSVREGVHYNLLNSSQFPSFSRTLRRSWLSHLLDAALVVRCTRNAPGGRNVYNKSIMYVSTDSAVLGTAPLNKRSYRLTTAFNIQPNGPSHSPPGQSAAKKMRSFTKYIQTFERQSIVAAVAVVICLAPTVARK